MYLELCTPNQKLTIKYSDKHLIIKRNIYTFTVSVKLK